MNKQTQLIHILKELFQTYPELEEKKETIYSYIDTFIKSKPQISLDPNFQNILKEKLYEEFCSHMTENSVKNKSSEPKFSWKDVFIFLGGGVVAAGAFLVINSPYFITKDLPLTYEKNENTQVYDGTSVREFEILRDFAIVEKDENAFGNFFHDGDDVASSGVGAGGMLSAPLEKAPMAPLYDRESDEVNETTQEGEDEVSEDSVMTDIENAKEESIEKIAPTPKEISISADTTMIRAPEQTHIAYMYDREEIPEIPAEVFVYKKNQTNVSLDIDTDNFSHFINLEDFANLEVKNIMLEQSKDDGYSFSFSSDGFLNIYKKRGKLEDPMRECYETDDEKERELCLQTKGIQKEDIPDDVYVIQKAKDFLEKYSISYPSYGEPFVDKFWENEGPKVIDDSFLIQEISVVFPYSVEGQDVVLESGYKDGMRVSLSISEDEVVSVNGQLGVSYEKSEYESVSIEEIENFLEKGREMYMSPEMEVRSEVELSHPQIVLMKYFSWEDGITEEYVFPALQFEIPEDVVFYPRFVSVPLVKSVLEKWEGR